MIVQFEKIRVFYRAMAVEYKIGEKYIANGSTEEFTVSAISVSITDHVPADMIFIESSDGRKIIIRGIPYEGMTFK
jgi:hypothetical protein